jgi:hypothetical protein
VDICPDCSCKNVMMCDKLYTYAINISHMADLGQLGSVSTMIRKSSVYLYSPNDVGTVGMLSSNRQTPFSSLYFAVILVHGSNIYLNPTK